MRVDARTGLQEALLGTSDLKAQLSALAGSSANLPPSLPFILQPGPGRILFQQGGRGFALDLASRKLALLNNDDLTARVALGQAAPSADGAMFLLPQPGGFAIADAAGRTIVERKGEPGYGWAAFPNAWSPNGRFLVAIRNDQRAVHQVPVVDYRTPLESVAMVPAAKAGTPLARTELHVVDTSNGSVKQLPPLQGEGYTWVAGWRPDGAEALVLHLSRDGKTLDLVGVDPSRGTTRLILREERPQSFVGALDFASGGWERQVKPLDGDRFVWMSERDGWRHAYLYDFSGKLERQVTRGRYVVEQVLGAAPGGKEILLVASADGPRPYDRGLYKADLRGGGMKRISTAPGDHQISLSPSGRYYTVAYSTFTEPRRTAVGSTVGGEAIEYSRADASRLATIGYLPPEPFTALAADGATTLHGALFKPWDFDPAKRYPVINLVYAGPFMTIVPRGFAASGTSGVSRANLAHGMAQLGFVVVMVDARGTPGRSKAFQDANYGRIGQTEIPDQIAAIRQAAAARPYMDLDRVGVSGHSWGGYFATRGMLTAGDFYKAGYAGAQGMLDEAAIINEPNMDLPSKNPGGYEIASNVRLAGNLRGAYKMMHGTADVNSSLSTSMRMADALIKANKQFDLLIMPGQPHNPPPPFDRYYFEDQVRFFMRHLGGPR
jgi:dipeptidyl aminopeptidase/acylaminoacyl peptidase